MGMDSPVKSERLTSAALDDRQDEPGSVTSAATEPLTASFFPSPTMDVDTPPKANHTDDTRSSHSLSPTLGTDAAPKSAKSTPSSTPTPSVTNGTTSKSTTPSLPGPSKPSKKAAPAPVQLIGDLPVARDAALKTFNEIFDNNYQYKTLGRSREVLESMACDCVYEHGVDDPDNACGPYSDCINRLTQVECLPEECRCKSYCQNQRFQKKMYAKINIVMTEKKGYGLRAEESILKDSFIYEYVGDVVNPASFKKRMRDYADEGIEHFYFMMLQKDEFIDATKSGGIGRFANHSCNPNCYVAKWTIGDHVRMGIFAKRDIKRHEELTFNYNVDRYGHQAQECYCGESNCIGFLGGKTQTDIATMDDLYLDALGITDEGDLMELKGTKKKKGKKIDDPDFMPMLKPVVEKEVPKVVQAVRQTSNRKVLFKLLTRIKITEDQAALRQIMRLRGYTLMSNVLVDNANDIELVILALQCMTTWPLQNRNKVTDSQVDTPVKSCCSLDNEQVKDLATKLLAHWDSLPVYTRIPKRVIEEREGQSSTKPTKSRVTKIPDSTIAKLYYPEGNSVHPLLSNVALVHGPPKRRRTNYINTFPVASSTTEAEEEERIRLRDERDARMAEQRKTIIALAVQQAAEQEAAIAAAAAAKEEAERLKAQKKAERASRKALTPEEKEALKEKKLLKLIGGVVVKCMTKHRKSFDHDSFKKYAKELTEIIAEKEKKSSSYRENRLESLSDDKVIKIKKFSKEYIAKVVRKLEKSGKRPPLNTSSKLSSKGTQPTPSTSRTPSDYHHDEDRDRDGRDIAMSVEEMMDMEPDTESDDDEIIVPPPGPGVEGTTMEVDMEESPSPTGHLSADPRLRTLSVV